jgi:hypothetical protein
MAQKNVRQIKLSAAAELETLYRRFQTYNDESVRWGKGLGWGRINNLQDEFGQVAKTADKYKNELDLLLKSLEQTFDEIGIPIPTDIAKRIQMLSNKLSSVDGLIQKKMTAGISKFKG